MGVLDQLKTWGERNPDATGQDWRVAQGQAWRGDDEDMPAVRAAARAGLPLTSVDAARLYGHQDATRNAPIRSNQERIDHLTRPDGPASDRFIDKRPRADRYVYVLLTQLTDRDADAGRAGREWYERNRNGLTVQQGSDWINRLKAKIEATNAHTPPVVDPGIRNSWPEWRELAAQLVEVGGPTGARFAVATEAGSDNDLAFWWIVRHEDQGGMVKYFLRQVIGGQGAVRVRMSPEAMVSIARKIMATGAKQAMLRFGQEIGSCGHCGRTLTNKASRDRGIGPVCAAHKGW